MKLDYFPVEDFRIDIPPINCSDRKILVNFALSFNAYKYLNGGTEQVRQKYYQVKEKLQDNNLSKVPLEDLRCCLFWRQRANRWNDIDDITEYQYWVELIREKCHM